MKSNGTFPDPYCRKEFWIEQLQTKSRAELEEYLQNFDHWVSVMEKEHRIAMSVNRSETFREALLELVKSASRRQNNRNQGELFD